MQISPMPPGPSGTSQNLEALKQVAQKLEASFLAEMLKSSGLGKSEGSFSGGVGEEQFSSFLRDEHAKLMVDAGGIGLAEHIFAALSKSNEPR